MAAEEVVAGAAAEQGDANAKCTVDEKIAAMEATQETQADNQLIQFRLINDLREATKKEPQLMQKDRADVFKALLAAC